MQRERERERVCVCNYMCMPVCERGCAGTRAYVSRLPEVLAHASIHLVGTYGHSYVRMSKLCVSAYSAQKKRGRAMLGSQLLAVASSFRSGN